MKTAQEIYDAYRIMPTLRLHQLRVAAVGKMITDHFSGLLDAPSVILACLFHDMGNIIKFDFDFSPLLQLTEPEGVEYWRTVQEEWIAKYGSDEHAASNWIAKEIGLPEPVRTLIDETRFSRLEAARDSAPFESKIVKYSDLRAGPFGVVPLADRLEEGRSRYAKRKGYDTPEGREQYGKSVEAAQEVERQIFARCSIRPENITEEAAAPIIEELRKYPLA
jgi:hypothetical protein